MSGAVSLRGVSGDRFFQVAIAVTLLAGVTLIVAITGAVRVQQVSAAPPAPSLPDSALRFVAAGEGVDIAGAVAHDLFTDDRRAPAQRYRLPGEAEAAVREPVPPPTVLGTAIGSGDDFAICQLSGGQPRIVRVGQAIGGFTVLSIGRMRVVFRSAGGEHLSIDASKP